MQALASDFEGVIMVHSAVWMLVNGWCDNCDGDPAECMIEGRCITEENEEDGGDDNEQKLV